ncbi:hypothetical protein [Cryobacterium sp. SO1]|uniref:hypothetical protein n=1 Tax=Cryobacterium sp. SO1 TaxID=1897061 RepID=UPI0010230A15|nr:hypothetical protein [Cryobacterium sp. SO1]RZI35614.1 hypothetical protein BJQ95_01985 [Cryobacterium sp. SO1]
MSLDAGTVTAEQRTELLNYEVAQFAAEGWTVSSVAGSQAALQRTKRIRFWLNVFLTFVTRGLWLFVVALSILTRKVESPILTVDHYGRVKRRFPRPWRPWARDTWSH